MNETEEQTSQEILSLDDIYFKDAFTKTEDKLNLEINNVDIDCMTSRNNKFSLDNNGNLIVKSITAETFNIQNIFDVIYPIGSIYISNSSINPSTLFGGTWQQIKGKFLLACDEEYPMGTIGGEKNHQLTINEMPQHNHGILNANSGGNMTGYNVTIGHGRGFGGNISTFHSGSSQPHNNMPPFMAVFVWERLS